MGLDLDFILREPGNSHGDAVGVIAGPLDIIGRIGLGTFWLSQTIENSEKPVKTDG